MFIHQIIPEKKVKIKEIIKYNIRIIIQPDNNSFLVKNLVTNIPIHESIKIFKKIENQKLTFSIAGTRR